MICACGASLKYAKATDAKLDRYLEYAQCTVCGRVGNEILREKSTGKLLGSGPEARAEYHRLKGD